MANLYKMVTGWTGGPFGPATSTVYATAIPSPTAMKAFWTAVRMYVPIGVTWTVPGSGDIIDDATGQLSGAWSTGADQTETSGATLASYPAPVGCVIRFTTATIVNGHRVKGRLFLVPLSGSQYENNGTLQGVAVTALQTAAATLVSAHSGTLAVWARPFAGRAATGSKPAIAARAGSSAIITGSTVPDRVAVLRSRRD